MRLSLEYNTLRCTKCWRWKYLIGLLGTGIMVPLMKDGYLYTLILLVFLEYTRRLAKVNLNVKEDHFQITLLQSSADSAPDTCCKIDSCPGTRRCASHLLPGNGLYLDQTSS